ncbi:thioredoxin-like protein [Chytriomyces sp. MP71]|nr:thioredoxin-like protein [Chytriomyces sp. MP71]
MATVNPTLADIHINTSKGRPFNLGEESKGKVVLVVNVASQCGFTPQYDGLEALYKKYKDQGLLILGVPTNDFNQEPTDGESCRLNFGVTFPILEKVHVNGPEQHELYSFLKSQKGRFLLGSGVMWNFEKFLLNKEGKVVERFASFTSPESIGTYVERELGKVPSKM